jgi:acyl carrier protein
VAWRWACDEAPCGAADGAGDEPAIGGAAGAPQDAIVRGGKVIDDPTFEKFRACAVEVLQVPPEKVVPEARFADDLDADSLDLVELVMSLEEAFDITVDESELDGIETVGQAYELITKKL